MRKKFFVTILAVVMATSLGAATTPAQAMTVQRSVSTKTEATESTTTNSSRPKKVVKAADWENEDGKIYMPFTGEYVRARYFNGLIKKLKSGVDILLLGDRPINAGGALNLCNIQLSQQKRPENGTVVIKVTNVSKENLEDVRLYIRQTNKKWQLFVDSLEEDVAYSEIAIGSGKVKAVEMLTEAGGAENLSKRQLMSASGVFIGADKSGDIKAGKTVTITITMK